MTPLGITEEGDEIMKEYEGSPALDAGLLAAAQAIEHYETSRQGTLRTWALELDMKDAARLLQTTLDEEQATAIALTSIVTFVVNRKAEGLHMGASKPKRSKHRRPLLGAARNKRSVLLSDNTARPVESGCRFASGKVRIFDRSGPSWLP